ncbi:MAG TPA: SDR family oxidoreductase [Nitrososphaerales archaeon]|nr:SDR family oxidoreductase [Nitrososphaerales archaeon]
MDLGLKDKVALVTGGSRGIGLRTIRVFAEEGCKVAYCSRNKEDLTKVESELRSRGVQVLAIQADVVDPGDAKRFLDQGVKELGGIDILVNNVGSNTGGNLMKSTDEDWRKTFETNLFQFVRMIRLVAPHMRKRGGGSIVNIASISGWEPQLAFTGQYGSSKAAMIFLAERFALELASSKIRVNTVSPGSIIWSGAGWDNFRKKYPESFEGYVRDGFPMGRLGMPEEVADVIVFLSSPRANWINGRNIPVDGLEQPVPPSEWVKFGEPA